MKNRKIIVFLSVILFIALFFLVINVIPPKKVNDNNPFIDNDKKVLMAAHRGGKNINPENTFKAFDYAINNFSIDILELDLVLTKDERLVVIHNETINESSDVNSKMPRYVKDYDLEELQRFNFGYKFKNKNGEYPYKDVLNNVNDSDKSEVLKENGLRIVTIEELFEKYKNKNLKYIIEIKDSNERGYKAADILTSNIKNNSLENNVVIGTFNTEVEKYLEEKYPDILRGASVGGAAKFVITQMLGVNLFDNSLFSCLQIPTHYNIKGININLDKKTYIKRAHRRGIAVQFWTINDKEEMRRLINLGADCIMTDSPDILYELLKEMNLR